jgi:hypothetical protein
MIKVNLYKNQVNIAATIVTLYEIQLHKACKIFHEPQ